MSDPCSFEWYDAWVLAALVYATEGEAPVPLWQVVSTADALNKSIVSRDELELALGRLDRAGYLRVAADGFEATPKALALKAPGPPLEAIARALGSKPWSSSTGMPRTPDQTYVSRDAYIQAVKKHQKEFWIVSRGKGLSHRAESCG